MRVHFRPARSASKSLAWLALGLTVVVAVAAALVIVLGAAERSCKQQGGELVTETTYGYRYTPGTTKWEYGPIYSTKCEVK